MRTDCSMRLRKRERISLYPDTGSESRKEMKRYESIDDQRKSSYKGK